MSDTVTLFLLLIAYKMFCVVVGLTFAFMGYRLFMADKLQSAGDFEGSSGEHKLTLRGAAPGTFFALFGTAVVGFTVWKGVDYNSVPPPNALAPPSELTLPALPPEKASK
jgi:hypothetical protein